MCKWNNALKIIVFFVVHELRNRKGACFSVLDFSNKVFSSRGVSSFSILANFIFLFLNVIHPHYPSFIRFDFLFLYFLSVFCKFALFDCYIIYASQREKRCTRSGAIFMAKRKTIPAKWQVLLNGRRCERHRTLFTLMRLVHSGNGINMWINKFDAMHLSNRLTDGNFEDGTIFGWNFFRLEVFFIVLG